MEAEGVLIDGRFLPLDPEGRATFQFPEIKASKGRERPRVDKTRAVFKPYSPNRGRKLTEWSYFLSLGTQNLKTNPVSKADGRNQ